MLVGDNGWSTPYGCSPGVMAGGGGIGRLEVDGRGWWLLTSALPCNDAFEAMNGRFDSPTKYPKALMWGARVPSNVMPF